jgi:hypothetical protein
VHSYFFHDNAQPATLFLKIPLLRTRRAGEWLSSSIDQNRWLFRDNPERWALPLLKRTAYAALAAGFLEIRRRGVLEAVDWRGKYEGSSQQDAAAASIATGNTSGSCRPACSEI